MTLVTQGRYHNRQGTVEQKDRQLQTQSNWSNIFFVRRSREMRQRATPIVVSQMTSKCGERVSSIVPARNAYLYMYVD